MTRRTLAELIAGAVAIAAIVLVAAQPPQTVYVPPQVRIVEVDVPGPTVEVEVPVVPLACGDAVSELNSDYLYALDFVIAVYEAYVEHPTENLTDFGRRVETIIANDQGPDDDSPDWVAACSPLATS